MLQLFAILVGGGRRCRRCSPAPTLAAHSDCPAAFCFGLAMTTSHHLETDTPFASNCSRKRYAARAAGFRIGGAILCTSLSPVLGSSIFRAAGSEKMESEPALRPCTPPLPPSAFAASAQQPWEVAHSPPSRSGAASPSLAAGSSLLSEGPRLSKSLSISRQGSAAVNPFGQSKPAAPLWRASTAVTERAASQGLSFEALCGDSYIPPEDLRKPKPLGEGAFAGEGCGGWCRCLLRA